MDINNISNFNPNLTRNSSQNQAMKTNSGKEENEGILVETNGENAIKNPSIKREVNNELDKDAFLKLLVTQLKYQDPLEPMDNTQFIAQTAQFTALEQMKNLNTTMTNAQAFNVIGKPIYAEILNQETGSLEAISGIVSSVEIRNGVPYVNVGGKNVAYSDIKLVGGVPEVGGNSEVVSQAMSLIGKTIQGILMDENAQNATGYIEGKVDFVKFVDGVPILSVNGKDVNLYEVVSVSEDTLLIGKEITIVNKEGEKLKGEISEINIKNVTENGKETTKIYVKVDGKEAEIENIGSLTSSIGLIGKNVTSGKISGKVDGVIIKEGKPYLLVGENEIYYKDIE